MRSPAAIVALLFLGSGFAGLVYEIVWVRMLGLLFGSTTLAVSTVLAVYFSGLSIGSYVFGRVADRTRRHPLRIYGALEIAAGALCLASPAIFSALDAVYVAIVRGADLSFGAASLVKLAGAFVALVGPTTLLGGTLPLVVRALAGAGGAAPGTRLAILYGVNTFGAVLGTLAAGFVLVPVVGVTGSLVVAAAIDLGAGVAAFALAKRLPAPIPAPREEVVRAAAAAPAGRANRLAPLAVAAVAGCVSLALEVLDTRAIVTLAGSTVYAFTVILAVFLLGIGIGSALVRRRAEALARSRAFLGGALALAGLLAAAALQAFALLPSARPALVAALGYSFLVDVAIVVLFAGVLVLPAAVVFGALFPVAARALAAGEADIGRAIGRAYAVNTVAGIAGSVLTGFVLLPGIGLAGSLRAVALVAAAAGGATALLDGARRAAVPLALALAAAAAAIVSPSLDRTRLTNDLARAGDAAAPEERSRVLFYRDGMDATVSVLERGGYRSLYVNGRIQARNDRANLRLYDALAILPIALAREPRDVLVVGLGSGITAGAASLASPGSLACVEISEDVTAGARFFPEENARILERDAASGFRLVHDDARSFLLASGDSWDVIAANAFLPSDAGAGALYTVEHFESCRRHLRPGGVMSQWIPLASLSEDDLATAIASFAAVFEDTTLWMVAGDLVLVGAAEPVAPDLARVRERLRAVEERAPRRLARSRIESAEQLLGFCVAGPGEARAAVAGAPLHTDDRPRLEYSAPRHVYRPNLAPNLSRVAAAAAARAPMAARVTGATPGEIAAIEAHGAATRLGLAARALDAEGKPEAAAAAFAEVARRSGARDPLADEAHADILSRQARAARAAGDAERELALRADAARLDPCAENGIELAVALHAAGHSAEAIERLEAIVREEPRLVEASVNLGVLLANEGRLDDAERELERAASVAPDRPEPLATLGAIAAARGDRAGALTRYRAARRLDPGDPALAEAIETLERE